MAQIQLDNGIIKIGDIVNRIEYYTQEVDYSVCYRVTGFQTYEGELQPKVLMLKTATMQPYITRDGDLARTTWLRPSEILKNIELSPKKQSLFSKFFGGK
ncbi:hypothetical protein QTL97_17570 [Sporosarcina thermotolerans]|uniref:NUDIX hydrolase n=1 Tax=Sporosarcina thermotolerans TaxID=633404 RepID=A0AAW9AI44_9BACL|nr:hypothetical protein [Sporosarcina thermotolerans]MDW0118736.1 hypothetical protein [Sporosarcina thermotolerans]WHT48420.1 hypothetical protein QNH10_00745 [Sporosarcina thermotolerans]